MADTQEPATGATDNDATAATAVESGPEVPTTDSGSSSPAAASSEDDRGRDGATGTTVTPTSVPHRNGLPWIAAALTLVIAGVMTFLWLGAKSDADRLQAVEDDRRAVILASNDFLATLFDWDAVDLDETLTELERQGTERIRADVAQFLDVEIAESLRALNTRSEGQVLDVFVQRLENGRAEVFAVVRQAVESDNLEGTDISFNYLDMRLLEQPDGEWLLDAAVLIDPTLGPPPLLGDDGT